MSPGRWVCLASAPIAGSPASTPRATPVCATGRRGRIGCRPGPAPRSSRSCSRPASSTVEARTGSVPSSASPARTVSRILRRHDVPAPGGVRPDDRRGDPGVEDHRGPLRTRPARRAASTWTSRRSAGSPTAAAGVPTAAQMGSDRRTEARPGSASTTSTPSSTTTAASPTPRSSPTRRPPPAPRSSPEPLDALRRRTASTDRRRHDRQPLELHPQQRRSPPSSTELGIDHVLIRPHCPWQNGKVERFNRTLQTEWAYRTSSPPTTNAPPPLHPGSSTTTLAAATAPSEASHRSADCHQPDRCRCCRSTSWRSSGAALESVLLQRSKDR